MSALRSIDLSPNRYYSIGEVADLCAIKPHVLRYWEQEFPQLKPNKRTGNRRYYLQADIVLIQQISDLLYVKGFTISGARQRLKELKAPSVAESVAARESASTFVSASAPMAAGSAIGIKAEVKNLREELEALLRQC